MTGNKFILDGQNQRRHGQSTLQGHQRLVLKPARPPATTGCNYAGTGIFGRPARTPGRSAPHRLYGGATLTCLRHRPERRSQRSSRATMNNGSLKKRRRIDGYSDSGLYIGVCAEMRQVPVLDAGYGANNALGYSGRTQKRSADHRKNSVFKPQPGSESSRRLGTPRAMDRRLRTVPATRSRTPRPRRRRNDEDQTHGEILRNNRVEYNDKPRVVPENGPGSRREGVGSSFLATTPTWSMEHDRQQTRTTGCSRSIPQPVHSHNGFERHDLLPAVGTGSLANPVHQPRPTTQTSAATRRKARSVMIRRHYTAERVSRAGSERRQQLRSRQLATAANLPANIEGTWAVQNNTTPNPGRREGGRPTC